ncbi:MAG: glycosyltransferase family 39 protein [Deltaproteobacteria bacterium]|nr:glycosyltransferase family 39 protein [Deltaproteobacteria bacterium]MBW2530875.1 glycosyltransferase family 39 protein [Deltaproteobacteria bacterium]
MLGFDWHAVGLPGQWPWSFYQRYPTAAWPWLCVLLGAACVGLRRREKTRRWLGSAHAWVERRPWPWLLALLIGMAALRAPHLDAPFTFDALTQRLLFGSLDITDIIAHRYADQRHPQLYYLLLHVFLWFGHGEAVARLPALLLSLAAAATLFALARPALGAVGALAATALLGLNVSFLAFSREVGDLTLFCFLVLLSTLLLLRFLRTPRRRTAIGFAAAEVGMLYAYYLAPLVVCAHAVVLALHGRQRRHRDGWTALLAALGLGVMALVDLVGLVRTDTGIRGVARVFPEHVWGERSMVELWAQLGAHLAPSVELLLVVTLLTAAGVIRLAPRPWRSPLATAVVGITVLATVAVGLAVPLVRLKPYYLLFVLPFLLLLVMAGCLGARSTGQPARATPNGDDRSGGWRAELGSGVGVGLLALLVGGYGADLAYRLDTTYQPFDAPRFRALGERIRREPGPRVVIADPNSLHTILLYYGFPEPLAMYRTCALPQDGGGTQCHYGDQHLVTLTALPYMTEGWDQRSRQRFDEARALGPSWVVYATWFANEPLREELDATCEVEASYAKNHALLLYRCP